MEKSLHTETSNLNSPEGADFNPQQVDLLSPEANNLAEIRGNLNPEQSAELSTTLDSLRQRAWYQITGAEVIYPQDHGEVPSIASSLLSLKTAVHQFNTAIGEDQAARAAALASIIGLTSDYNSRESGNYVVIPPPAIDLDLVQQEIARRRELFAEAEHAQELLGEDSDRLENGGEEDKKQEDKKRRQLRKRSRGYLSGTIAASVMVVPTIDQAQEVFSVMSEPELAALQAYSPGQEPDDTLETNDADPTADTAAETERRVELFFQGLRVFEQLADDGEATPTFANLSSVDTANLELALREHLVGPRDRVPTEQEIRERYDLDDIELVIFNLTFYLHQLGFSEDDLKDRVILDAIAANLGNINIVSDISEYCAEGAGGCANSGGPERGMIYLDDDYLLDQLGIVFHEFSHAIFDAYFLERNPEQTTLVDDGNHRIIFRSGISDSPAFLITPFTEIYLSEGEYSDVPLVLPFIQLNEVIAYLSNEVVRRSIRTDTTLNSGFLVGDSFTGIVDALAEPDENGDTKFKSLLSAYYAGDIRGVLEVFGSLNFDLEELLSAGVEGEVYYAENFGNRPAYRKIQEFQELRDETAPYQKGLLVMATLSAYMSDYFPGLYSNHLDINAIRDSETGELRYVLQDDVDLNLELFFEEFADEIAEFDASYLANLENESIREEINESILNHVRERTQTEIENPQLAAAHIFAEFAKSAGLEADYFNDYLINQVYFLQMRGNYDNYEVLERELAGEFHLVNLESETWLTDMLADALYRMKDTYATSPSEYVIRNELGLAFQIQTGETTYYGTLYSDGDEATLIGANFASSRMLITDLIAGAWVDNYFGVESERMSMLLGLLPDFELERRAELVEHIVSNLESPIIVSHLNRDLHPDIAWETIINGFNPTDRSPFRLLLEATNNFIQGFQYTTKNYSRGAGSYLYIDNMNGTGTLQRHMEISSLGFIFWDQLDKTIPSVLFERILEEIEKDRIWDQADDATILRYYSPTTMLDILLEHDLFISYAQSSSG